MYDRYFPMEGWCVATGMSEVEGKNGRRVDRGWREDQKWKTMTRMMMTKRKGRAREVDEDG